MNSTFGKNITYSLFGESHGKGVGITIHGLRAGIKIPTDYIDAMLSKRKTGGKFVTPRKEPDNYTILSGVSDGYTNSFPLTFFIENKDANSKEYKNFRDTPRPSHSDYVNYLQNGEHAELRGSGHFSGRLTAPLVIAGAIILSELEKEGIKIATRIKSVLDVVDDAEFNLSDVADLRTKRIQMLSEDKISKVLSLIEKAQQSGDSLGAMLETKVFGMKSGVGNPFFYSVESVLSSLLFSVPAVKSVSFGSGEKFAEMTGSKANDEFVYVDELVKTKTNHSGGINAGISNGMELVINTAMRPATSIALEQNTVNLKTGKNDKITVNGRHDPLIAIRAVPVIESVTAIGIYELLLSDRR